MTALLAGTAFSQALKERETEELLRSSALRVEAFYERQSEEKVYQQKRLSGLQKWKERQQKRKEQRDELRKTYVNKRKGQRWRSQQWREQLHSDHLLAVEREKKKRDKIRQRYLEKKRFVAHVLKEKGEVIPADEEYGLDSSWLPDSDSTQGR